MRKRKFKITTIIAIVLCFVLAVSALSGCSNTPGKDGVDGITPHIGENGNWWIGDKDTGVSAAGVNGTDGKDGVDGVNGTDGKDGVDGVNGVDGINGVDGQNGVDGITPHIGTNGNWWIGTKDTGVKAAGQDSVPEEYVTPEMFGAVGDGKADDTAAVQKALKTGKPVFLTKTYRVTELDCTGLSEIAMYGKEDVTARLSPFPVKDDVYNIIFEGKLLFKNAPSRISLEQLRFFAKNKGTLITAKVAGAWIHRCNFTYFGGMFMGGMDGQSQISENVFFQMKGTFATDCVDSTITNNYINSALEVHATMFTGTNFTGMYFQGNFVDYCKTAFGKYTNWEYNLIENNLFDCVFRVFETETSFNNTTVTGNTFYYTGGPDGWDGYADAQMKSEDWRVFTITGGCNRTNISGNAGDMQVALKMTNVNNPCDTFIDLSGVKGTIEFGYYNTSNAAGSTIVVKDLDYITVNSLPSAALYNAGGATLTSFNKQHVIYQENLYMNLNGKWIKITDN